MQESSLELVGLGLGLVCILPKAGTACREGVQDSLETWGQQVGSALCWVPAKWQCLKTHPWLCTAQGGVLMAKSKPQWGYSKSPISFKPDFKEVPVDDSRAVDIGYLDLSKAFNTISHNILQLMKYRLHK